MYFCVKEKPRAESGGTECGQPLSLSVWAVAREFGLLVAAHVALEPVAVRGLELTVHDDERAVAERSRREVEPQLRVHLLVAPAVVDLHGRGRLRGGRDDGGRDHGGRADDERCEQLLHLFAPSVFEGHQPGIELMCTILP